MKKEPAATSRNRASGPKTTMNAPTSRRLLLIGTALALLALSFTAGRLSVSSSDVGACLQAIPVNNRLQAGSYLEAFSTSSPSLLAPHPLATPATEQALCNQLQQVAATEPLRALELAKASPTPRQRELLRNAALQGWATRDPHAAAVWTLANVRSEERRIVVEAIAAGAITQPAVAINTINFLIAADPLLASDHGNALVTAFTRIGAFDTASQFAATGPAEFRAAWLCTTFNQWATYQPQAALAALGKINDPAVHAEARAGLYAGWSSSDPAALVAYAQALPIGEARLEALNTGLAQWVHLNPGAASIWMDKFDPAPDLDAGAAAIAITPALVAKKPDVAAGWAESITDPELRASTLLDLIRLWAAHDATGAHRYAATSPALSPETRQLALTSFEPSP